MRVGDVKFLLNNGGPNKRLISPTCVPLLFRVVPLLFRVVPLLFRVVPLLFRVVPLLFRVVPLLFRVWSSPLHRKNLLIGEEIFLTM